MHTYKTTLRVIRRFGADEVGKSMTITDTQTLRDRQNKRTHIQTYIDTCIHAYL